MQKIGFSHGVLYKVMDNYTKEAFDIFTQNGSKIIEICVAKIKELDRLNKIIPFIRNYPYKSIHLPTDIEYDKDKATRNVLICISSFYKKIGANLALVHPDLVRDWNIFEGYPLDWAIENMDNRKKSYRNLAVAPGAKSGI